jgi:hypothetical protein
VPALVVFMMFMLCSSVVRAESRTSEEQAIIPDTNKYDINDPRNPDCPCHKAQKLADDEYRQSQRGNDNPVDRNPVNNDNDVNRGNDADRGNGGDNVNTNTDINTNKTTYSGGSGGSQKHYSATYKFSKKMKRWTKKMSRKLRSKNKGTKGGKFRVADCFHFM